MNSITAAENGIAPRILQAWAAMQAVLADQEWHERAELTEAATATGITVKTAENMIYDATSRGFRGRLHKRGRGSAAEYRSPA